MEIILSYIILGAVLVVAFIICLTIFHVHEIIQDVHNPSDNPPRGEDKTKKQ